jgi:hypothetical protein
VPSVYFFSARLMASADCYQPLQRPSVGPRRWPAVWVGGLCVLLAVASSASYLSALVNAPSSVTPRMAAARLLRPAVPLASRPLESHGWAAGARSLTSGSQRHRRFHLGSDHPRWGVVVQQILRHPRRSPLRAQKLQKKAQHHRRYPPKQLNNHALSLVHAMLLHRPHLTRGTNRTQTHCGNLRSDDLHLFELTLPRRSNLLRSTISIHPVHPEPQNFSVFLNVWYSLSTPPFSTAVV